MSSNTIQAKYRKTQRGEALVLQGEQSNNILQAKCRKPECAHVWTVAHLPMDLLDVATCAKRATCPKCADTKPLVNPTSKKS